jgi:hypothetical protein
VRVLARVAPGLRLGNGIDARRLSHDAAVVQAYQADPLVHDRISVRLAHSCSAPDRPSSPARALAGAHLAAVRRPGRRRARPAARPCPRRAAAGDGAGVSRALPRSSTSRTGPVFSALHDWLIARFAGVDQAQSAIK